MFFRFTIVTLLAALGAALPAQAQTSLSLADAVARARSRNIEARVAAVEEREAAQREVQARAGHLPRVDVSESWQRGDQPVFVFSSLLAQRRFTAADFALDALNHPGSIGNFRAAVTVEQPLFDRATHANVRTAAIGREMAAAAREQVGQDLAAAATEAYGRVLIAEAGKQSASAAIEAAQADRTLAVHRRDAGLATDADVLQIDVHLSRARAQQIRVEADERIARARLNQIMGEPLDSIFTLVGGAAAIAIDTTALPPLEAEALAHRPGVKRAALQEQLAVSAQAAARAAFVPQVSAQAGWELNGREWSTRASSWVVGVTARVNVFRGFADRARLAEAGEQAIRRALERERAETAARLDIHIAVASVDAARAREAVGRAALTQAREARRIARDRYEHGLTDITSLLRAAEAEMEAETQRIAAEVDVFVAAAVLQRALGR